MGLESAALWRFLNVPNHEAVFPSIKLPLLHTSFTGLKTCFSSMNSSNLTQCLYYGLRFYQVGPELSYNLQKESQLRLHRSLHSNFYFFLILILQLDCNDHFNLFFFKHRENKNHLNSLVQCPFKADCVV